MFYLVGRSYILACSCCSTSQISIMYIPCSLMGIWPHFHCLVYDYQYETDNYGSS